MIDLTVLNHAGYQAYQKNKYETASPHKLIWLLYDGAINNLRRAQAAIDQSESNEANRFILKAQDIIYELMSCLNEEQGGEIARNLREIYFYCVNQLIQANIRKEKALLQEVEGYIDSLRSAWIEIGKDVGLAARS